MGVGVEGLGLKVGVGAIEFDVGWVGVCAGSDDDLGLQLCINTTAALRCQIVCSTHHRPDEHLGVILQHLDGV